MAGPTSRPSPGATLAARARGALACVALGACALGCGSAFLVTGDPLRGEPSPTLLRETALTGDARLLGLDDRGVLLLRDEAGLRRMGRDGRVLWTRKVPGEIRNVLAAPNGTTLVLLERAESSEGDDIVWIDAKGATIREARVPNGAECALGPGLVYVRSGDRVGAIDLAGGALQWIETPPARKVVGTRARRSIAAGALAVAPDRAALVTAPETVRDILTVRRVDASGAVSTRWPVPSADTLAHVAPLPDGSLAVFALAPETDVVAAARATLLLFRPDGSVAWQREVPIGHDTSEMAIDASGNIILAFGSTVRVLGADGTDRWSRNLCLGVDESACGAIRALAVGPKGVLYVGHRQLEALRPGGEPLWRFTGVRGEVGDIVMGDGRLYVTDRVEADGEEETRLLVIGGDGEPRPNARYARYFRPGLGGLLEPPFAEAPPPPAQLPAARSADEALCAWGEAEGCLRHARALAADPATAGEALAILGPLCGRPTDPGCKALEETLSALDRVDRTRATDLLAVRCAGGQKRACELACERGEPASCYLSCINESAPACTMLGKLYQSGRGVAASMSRSLGALNLACAYGAKDACTLLVEVARDEELSRSTGAELGALSPSDQGFDAFVAGQMAALKRDVSKALEGARKANRCAARDSCCLARQYLTPLCGVLDCARVPGCR